MQNDNDPYPFSLSLLDQSKQESFWCGSRKHAFLYWVSMVLALIPQFMGAVTFLETAVCTGVTGFTLLVSAFYQEGEVRFAYFFFALFTFCAFMLLKIVLVGKVRLQLSLPMNSKSLKSTGGTM